jgi:oxygen-independent coproporphyrinogen-3 oxidase
MGLRLGEGIDLAALGARFGLPETALIDPAKRAFHTGNGLLREEGPRLIVTEAGMPCSTRCWPNLFLPIST